MCFLLKTKFVGDSLYVRLLRLASSSHCRGQQVIAQFDEAILKNLYKSL